MKSKQLIREDDNPVVPSLLVDRLEWFDEEEERVRTKTLARCWRCQSRCRFCSRRRHNFPKFGHLDLSKLLIHTAYSIRLMICNEGHVTYIHAYVRTYVHTYITMLTYEDHVCMPCMSRRKIRICAFQSTPRERLSGHMTSLKISILPCGDK